MWDPRWFTFKAYMFFGGILLSGHMRGMVESLNIINIYAPYVGRQSFWIKMQDSGILGLPNLIMMGDLNLTLQSDEIWGSAARLDPLSCFFNDRFSNLHMVDIRPCPLIPTWTNKRCGGEYIGKILDRALVNDKLIDRWGTPRSMVMVSDVSDHMPISLSWNTWTFNKGIPYNFNRVWLKDDEYINLVKSTWQEEDGCIDLQIMDRFQDKLQRLKAASKIWEKQKKASLKAELMDITL